MTRRLLIAVSCSLSALLTAPVAGAADGGTWAAAGQLGTQRGAPVSALLPDGSALVGGGAHWSTASASVQRYDPVGNTWSAVAGMGVPRSSAATVVLRDGRVLVTGGRSDGYHSLASAEIYDPATNTWSATAPMNTARSLHDAVLLQDGRVLAVGGDGIYAGTAGAEVYSPETDTWTPTGPVVTARSQPAVVALADGKVLAVGGWNGDSLASAELFDPTTNTWASTGSMGEKRNGPGAARLPDGRVVVAGGHGWADLHPTVSQSSELYDPATGRWSPGATLNTPRGEGLVMGTLRDGRPFVSGGFWWTDVKPGVGGGLPTWSKDRYEDTLEVFEPSSNRWWQSSAASFGRSDHAVVLLRDGSLLVAGGYTRWIQYGSGAVSETAADRYYPPGTAQPEVTSTPVPPATPSPEPVPPRVATLSKLPSKLTLDKRNRIAFVLRCAGPGTCKDTLVLRTRTGKRLASTKVSIAGGRKGTVKLTLSKSALRSLKRGSNKVTLELATRKLATKATLTRR